MTNGRADRNSLKNQCRIRPAVRAVCVLILFVLLAFGNIRPQPAYAASTETKVHTLYWKATLRRSVKVGGKSIKSGTTVVVTERGGKGRKSTVSYKGQSFKVPNSWIYIRSDLASAASKGDYRKEVKESFINHRSSASSKTSWLVWISLDKQRVNVFRGTKKNWSLVKVFKCSTGKASTPTQVGRHYIDFKKMYVSGCKYYTEFCGSGMHKWPGTLNKKVLGNHTVSHGCVRLTESDAKWIYTHVAKKSTVLVY